MGGLPAVPPQIAELLSRLGPGDYIGRRGSPAPGAGISAHFYYVSIMSGSHRIATPVNGSAGHDPCGPYAQDQRQTHNASCDPSSFTGERTVQTGDRDWKNRSEEHTSELQSRFDLVC